MSEPTYTGLTATADFQAADAKRLPSFSAVAYTGGPVQLPGFSQTAVLDFKGLTIDRLQIPVFLGTDPERVVGMTDAIAIDRAGLVVGGVITGEGADAQEVVSQAKNGFRWKSYTLVRTEATEFLQSGSNVTINGREVSGPLTIVRRATLKAIALHPIGNDLDATALIQAIGPPREIIGTVDKPKPAPPAPRKPPLPRPATEDAWATFRDDRGHDWGLNLGDPSSAELAGHLATVACDSSEFFALLCDDSRLPELVYLLARDQTGRVGDDTLEAWLLSENGRLAAASALCESLSIAFPTLKSPLQDVFARVRTQF